MFCRRYRRTASLKVWKSLLLVNGWGLFPFSRLFGLFTRAGVGSTIGGGAGPGEGEGDGGDPPGGPVGR